GKSTLVFDVLARAATDRRARVDADRVEGLDAIERVLVVGPRLPPRNARSSPATFLGVAAVLRELFASTPSARAPGFAPARFSATRGGDAESGRCEACAGLGFRTVDLDLLEPVTTACEVCRGTRFAASTLEIRWKGRSFAELLDLPIERAA